MAQAEEKERNTCVPVSVLLFLLAQIKSKGLSPSAQPQFNLRHHLRTTNNTKNVQTNDLIGCANVEVCVCVCVYIRMLK